MSRSTDPGHFFQTDASEATRARRAAKSGNKNGTPLKLQSKILSVIADPFSESSIYVAESAGCVRWIDLKTRDSKRVYRGPTAPVTSVAISGINGDTIFAGCWDKDIWSWDRQTQTARKRLKGHSDFVKTILSAKLGGKDIIVSGGADSKIIVWDAVSGEKLHTLRDKLDTMRALQYLVIDPIETTPDTITLLSSSSDPQIRRWKVTISDWVQIMNEAPTPAVSETIKAHETSVYSMVFSSFTEAEDSDLWSASADGTAKCLSRSLGWSVEETLEHGDYVRAIAVSDNYIITAGRSEDVKMWDRSSGKLWHVYEGHFEEITGLLVIGGRGIEGEKLISVSIDGTIRTWPLDKKSLNLAIKEKDDRKQGIIKEEVAKPVKKSLMTAEEEAELAELMDDSD